MRITQYIVHSTKYDNSLLSYTIQNLVKIFILYIGILLHFEETATNNMSANHIGTHFINHIVSILARQTKSASGYFGTAA